MNELYTINQTDYISHHGILGQKWGVRRYQNPDGSLTSAGQKRYYKMDKYRNKMANNADKKSKSYMNKYKVNKQNVNDLEENGIYSNTYKKWQREEERKRANEYARKNSVTVDNNVYSKNYYTSGTRAVDQLIDRIGSKQKVQELISKNNREAQFNIDKAKKWTLSNERLLNMDISALTSKRDIKKAYKANPKIEKVQKTSSYSSNKAKMSKQELQEHFNNTYTKEFENYLKKTTGAGFDKYDDKDLVSLISYEYEEKTGSKATK